MSLEVLDKIIYSASKDEFSSFRFTWHGGEPLAAGVEFFQEVIRLQKKYFGRFRYHRYENIVQTNGLLLSNKYFDLFSENNFHLGFSIDGPDLECNEYRFGMEKDPQKKLDHTISKFREVKKRGLNLFVIFVIHDKNIKRASDIYKFICEIKADSVSFNPKFNSHLTSENVDVNDYSGFLKEIFFLHKERGSEKPFLSNIEKYYSHAIGKKTNMCYLSNKCDQFLCINSDGEIFLTCTDELGFKVSSDIGELGQFLSQRKPRGNIISTPINPYLDLGCPKYSHRDKKEDIYINRIIEMFRMEV
ncbi:radical SAM protein [Vibrio sp. B1REV9]|uniref:radical SAM protein n=1 Tax=Vibrio sp. B1REV9 TaxID=2751179 RepID=UPI0021E12517|nr:hypothetical protein [Vibrio sp. B1REV9]